MLGGRRHEDKVREKLLYSIILREKIIVNLIDNAVLMERIIDDMINVFANKLHELEAYTVAKNGSENLSLSYVETNAKSHDELDKKYNDYRVAASHHGITTELNDGSTIKISLQGSEKQMGKIFGINTSSLNFRQCLLITAAISSVINAVTSAIASENKANDTLQDRTIDATKAVLHRINFSQLGMKAALDFKPKSEFISSLKKIHHEIFYGLTALKDRQSTIRSELENVEALVAKENTKRP